MKSSVGIVLVLALVFALGGFEVWQYQQQQQYRAATQSQLMDLSSRLENLELTLNKAQSEMRTMQESSLGGLIENANDAMIQGWSAMMNAVEQELESARQSFEKKRKEMQQNREAEQQGGPAPDGQGLSSDKNGSGPL